MQAQDNTVHSINTWILKVLFLFTYITDLLKQSSSKHVGITSQSSIAHLKIPQHTSKLGESTYGKTPCVHSSSLDLRQEKGSRSSSSENQPLTMGVPGENTFVLGCMSCVKIVPFFKVHLTSVFQCTICICSTAKSIGRSADSSRCPSCREDLLRNSFLQPLHITFYMVMRVCSQKLRTFRTVKFELKFKRHARRIIHAYRMGLNFRRIKLSQIADFHYILIQLCNTSLKFFAD